MSRFKLLGWADEITVCDCCGKKNLSGTVALETEGGEVVYYGCVCAGRALRIPGKLVRDRANELRKAAPVADVVRAALAAGKGWEAAKAEGMEAGKRVMINGATVLTGGFASWGFLKIHWNGGEIRVGLA